jgi:hypothetical protein
MARTQTNVTPISPRATAKTVTVEQLWLLLSAVIGQVPGAVALSQETIAGAEVIR